MAFEDFNALVDYAVANGIDLTDNVDRVGVCFVIVDVNKNSVNVDSDPE